MLKLEAVSKQFRGGHFGVREVSLDLKSGVIGLLGPNGAGKTTLMQMIATITRPTSGRILFEGVDVTSALTTSDESSAIYRRTSGFTKILPRSSSSPTSPRSKG